MGTACAGGQRVSRRGGAAGTQQEWWDCECGGWAGGVVRVAVGGGACSTCPPAAACGHRARVVLSPRLEHTSMQAHGELRGMRGIRGSVAWRLGLFLHSGASMSLWRMRIEWSSSEATPPAALVGLSALLTLTSCWLAPSPLSLLLLLPHLD